MTALDELKLTENTIVVLWSDHGYHLGEHNGIWQKRTPEQSARPLDHPRPGIKGNGTASTRIVEFVDIYPTLTDLAGLNNPKGLEGRSLKPLLQDPLAEWNGTAITQVLRPADKRLPKPVMGRSIRTDRWRYSDWAEGNAGVELYDHAADPMEFNNLALKPDVEAKVVAKRLRKLLEPKAMAKCRPRRLIRSDFDESVVHALVSVSPSRRRIRCRRSKSTADCGGALVGVRSTEGAVAHGGGAGVGRGRGGRAVVRYFIGSFKDKPADGGVLCGT